MKALLSLLFFFGAIAAGTYVGFFLLFVGGISGIIEAIQSDSIEAIDLAISILKIIFAAPIGWLCAGSLLAISAGIAKS